LLSNFCAGGAETQYANLIRNIDRNRFDPILGIIEYKDNVASEDFLERFGTVRRIAFKRRSSLDFNVVPKITKFIKSSNIDIIQSLLFMDNQIGRLAGFMARRPVITSVRGEIEPILGFFKTWFEFKAQILSKRIVVNSHWLKQYLIEKGSTADKIVTIHNGIDFQKYQCLQDTGILKTKYGIEQDMKVITIVARLHPMKDHITFLDTVALIKKSCPNIKALIVGAGSEREQLERYTKKNQLGDTVLFLGSLGEQLPEIYRISDLLLLTSQWGESFPNVLAEAMSASVPVVASRISAVEEIIDDGHNGFVVPKKDCREFAERSLMILNNNELATKLRIKGRNRAHKFGISEMVNKFETLYVSLVRSRQ